MEFIESHAVVATTDYKQVKMSRDDFIRLHIKQTEKELENDK